MLNVALKNHVLFLSYRSIELWYSPLTALFGLTWRMLTPCYDIQTGQLNPLWSFSFWLVISLYALINNVLSLCMIMAIIALLFGRSQSLASLHLYWVWALLVHRNPWNQVIPKSPPYLPICGISPPLQSKFLICYL